MADPFLLSLPEAGAIPLHDTIRRMLAALEDAESIFRTISEHSDDRPMRGFAETGCTIARTAIDASIPVLVEHQVIEPRAINMPAPAEVSSNGK